MSQQSEEKDTTNKTGRIDDGNMKEVDLERNTGATGKTKIEVREKKGLLRLAIPQVSVPAAWLVLFLNVFAPGTGTLVLSLLALCGVKTDFKKQNRCLAFLINFGTALLQTITAVIIVGWIWSVYWGMHTVTEANERSENAKMKRRLEEAADAEEKERLNNDTGENQEEAVADAKPDDTDDQK